MVNLNTGEELAPTTDGDIIVFQLEADGLVFIGVVVGREDGYTLAKFGAEVHRIPYGFALGVRQTEIRPLGYQYVNQSFVSVQDARYAMAPYRFTSSVIR